MPYLPDRPNPTKPGGRILLTMNPPPVVHAARVLLSLVLVVALSACAGVGPAGYINEAVNIERIHSTRVEVASVQVYDHDGQLQVRGRLKKLHRGRSLVPGHLHIEALDQEKNLLGQSTTSYHQLSAKTGTYSFATLLPVRAEKVRTVRIVHRVAGDS